MKTATALLVGVLGQTLFLTLVAGAALGLVIGLLLLVDSERALRWNAYMNRWISTGNALSVLDQPRDIKRLIYHWHRVVGLLVIAGALYSVNVLAFDVADRKSTRLNSSHLGISYAVFCLKKKKKNAINENGQAHRV